MSDWSPPMLGFDGRDDACTEDAQPLMVRWKTGGVIAGILAPLDPKWLKAYREDLERSEALRAEPNVILLEDYKHAQN